MRSVPMMLAACSIVSMSIPETRIRGNLPRRNMLGLALKYPSPSKKPASHSISGFSPRRGIFILWWYSPLTIFDTITWDMPYFSARSCCRTFPGLYSSRICSASLGPTFLVMCPSSPIASRICCCLLFPIKGRRAIISSVAWIPALSVLKGTLFPFFGIGVSHTADPIKLAARSTTSLSVIPRIMVGRRLPPSLA